MLGVRPDLDKTNLSGGLKNANIAGEVIGAYVLVGCLMIVSYLLLRPDKPLEIFVLGIGGSSLRLAVLNSRTQYLERRSYSRNLGAFAISERIKKE